MQPNTHVHDLPVTASACLAELDRIREYEKAVVNRMREILSCDANSERHSHLATKAAGPGWHQPGDRPTKGNIKQLSDLHIENTTTIAGKQLEPSDKQMESHSTVPLTDDRSDDFKWDTIQAQLTLHEDKRTSPLIDALKKMEWRARDHAEIAKWCSELAVMFFKADENMNGRILEEGYVSLIKSLPLSSSLKNDLYLQFSCIDLTKSGDVTLEEFLYFFLSFPPFKKELASSFHANEPFHNILGNVAAWRKVRLWVYNVATVPSFNMFSKLLFCFDLLLSLVPFIMLYLELISPSIHPEKISLLWFMALFFAAHYVVGLITCKSKIQYLVNRLHIVELISFLPWMIYNFFELNENRELPSSNHPFFVGSRGAIGYFLIRISKIIMLPSILPSSAWLQEDIDIYVKTLHLALASYKPLGWCMFFLVMLLSTLVYAFERGEHNGEFWERYDDSSESSPFSNFFNCCWFTIVTGTTLGYGDFYPKSYEGKLVGMLIVVIGLVNLTIVINTIGECFEEIFRTFLENRSKKIQAERAHYIKSQVELAGRKVEDLQRKHTKSPKHFHIVRKIEMPLRNLGTDKSVAGSPSNI